MSETSENVKKIVEPPCFGRQKYYTAYKPEDITKENVVEIVKNILMILSLKLILFCFWISILEDSNQFFRKQEMMKMPETIRLL